MKKRVVVGLSGGVDSAVTAGLLQEQGYEVEGVYLEAWREPGCRAEEDRQDAVKVAVKLGIPFRVVDVREEYKKRVVEYFFKAYERGITPNPDIVCNREIKFGIFYEWSRQAGYDYVATGHYARLVAGERWGLGKGKWLARGKDKKKDQSYFLWQVGREKWRRVLLPLGEWQKEEVREKAREWGLAVAEKADSMGICFIGEVDVREMLKARLGVREGEVVMRGEVVGKHKGLWFYTIGQRGGFEVDKKKLKRLGWRPERMKPLYVVAKDTNHNRLIIGERSECLRNKFVLENWRLEVGKEVFEREVGRGRMRVRIRNLGKLYKVKRVEIVDKGGIEIETEAKIFGVAPGQGGVFYWQGGEEGEEIVVGGGEIGNG